MKRLLPWFIMILLFNLTISAMAQHKVLPKRTAERAKETKRKEIQREKDNARRKELERESEARRRKQEAERKQDKQLTEHATPSEVRPWGAELTRFVREAPEHTKWKGCREHLLAFDAHFNQQGRRPMEHEINRWIERNVSTEPVRQSNFRGTLREVSIVQMLQAEGHAEVKWNREPESTRTVVEGRSIDLGARIIDIIARDPQTRELTYYEIKHADLNKALRKHEVKRLAERKPIAELVKTADPKGSTSVSREFREIVKDMLLIERDGRKVEWVVNSAPNNMTTYLQNYGIRLHLVH